MLQIGQVDKVVEHHSDTCFRCSPLLKGADPLLHQVIEIAPIAPIAPLLIEHRLHRQSFPCCSTSTCFTLPPDVEASHYGSRLSALVGLLGSAFPLSFRKTLDPVARRSTVESI
jgi:transposase